MVLADLALRPEADELLSRYDAKDKSPRAVFVKTDVTSWPALDNMFDVAYTEFGDVDIVCPGAGVYEPHWSNFWCPPGSEKSRDAIDANHYALLDINLTHPIRTTQMAISRWLYPRGMPGSAVPTPAAVSPSNPKRIVHISSVAVQAPTLRAPLYNASKAAISGFVRSIAPLEEEYGIRVNAVAPGVVRTPLWTDNPEKMANLDQSTDAWVTPEEVAAAMMDCVESESTAGGAVVEIGAGYTRHVGLWNDPGPDLRPEAGMFTSNAEAGNQEVHGFLRDSSVWGKPAR